MDDDMKDLSDSEGSYSSDVSDSDDVSNNDCKIQLIVMNYV